MTQEVYRTTNTNTERGRAASKLVTQDHWDRHGSISYLWLPISNHP